MTRINHDHVAMEHAPATGSRLVAADGRSLPLQATTLRAGAAGGLARVVLEQRFTNTHPDPLVVTYSLPLPHEAAVSGFAFRIGARRVVGEIDRRAEARERYEAALAEGRSSALLESERGSLFTQEIGNIPPGETVTCEITLDHRLAWLPEGAWEWRFPTVVAPRYLGAEGRVPDAARIEQEVALSHPARLALDLTIGEPIADGGAITSPSHAVDVRGEGSSRRVALAAADPGALDRDVVVRWTAAPPSPQATLEVARPDGSLGTEAFGLLTLVPPSRATPIEAVPRDLVLLLDVSGSMSGAPIAQLKRIATALVGDLGERDTLEMVAFSSGSQRWDGSGSRVSEDIRKRAAGFIRDLTASGGTEMLSAMHDALRPMREGAQRQVVLMTDGEIGFESEVVGAIRDRLPAGSRLHVVGIGPAVNRSLTSPCARAGRGVELVVAPHEDAGPVIGRLRARLSAPLVTELQVTGAALVASAPRALPDLLAGAPVLIGLQLRPEGGALELVGRTPSGQWRQRLTVPACEPGHGRAELAALFARELVEDLEVDHAAGRDGAGIDSRVEALGLRFGIATRLTSWVAISEEPDVDPSKPFRRVRQPQALPQGLSAEGLGLRGGSLTAACLSVPAFLRVEDWDASQPSRSRGHRIGRAMPTLGLRVLHAADGPDGNLEVEIEIASGELAADEIVRVELRGSCGRVECQVMGSSELGLWRLVGRKRLRLHLRPATPVSALDIRWLVLRAQGQELVLDVEESARE